MTDFLDRRVDPEDPALASAVDEASLWSARFGCLMLDNLEMAGGLSVLDLGCGNGFPLFELAHRLGTSCRLVGLDVWKPALRRAAEKRATYELKNADLVRGDGERTPFRDSAFDLVVSNVGVNNFADPWVALEECGRVTRPGGRIALTTNPKGHLAELYDAYRSVLRRTGRSELIAALDEEESHRPTRGELDRMLDGGRFSVDRVVEDAFWLRFLDGAAMMRHPLVWLGFLDGWRSILPQGCEHEVFAALEDELNDRARALGELRMRVPMLFVTAVRRST